MVWYIQSHVLLFDVVSMEPRRKKDYFLSSAVANERRHVDVPRGIIQLDSHCRTQTSKLKNGWYVLCCVQLLCISKSLTDKKDANKHAVNIQQSFPTIINMCQAWVPCICCCYGTPSEPNPTPKKVSLAVKSSCLHSIMSPWCCWCRSCTAALDQAVELSNHYNGAKSVVQLHLHDRLEFPSSQPQPSILRPDTIH